jgi:hypothetical protein
MHGDARYHSHGSHEFWTARSTKPPNPTTFQVNWAWSDGGQWTAAGDSRLAFNRAAALFKLYVVCCTPAEARTDPAQDFLTDFLPEFQRSLPQP